MLSGLYGWQVDWLRPDKRADWLVREAGKALDSEDPLRAAAEWLRGPPSPPRRLFILDGTPGRPDPAA